MIGIIFPHDTSKFQRSSGIPEPSLVIDDQIVTRSDALVFNLTQAFTFANENDENSERCTVSIASPDITKDILNRPFCDISDEIDAIEFRIHIGIPVLNDYSPKIDQIKSRQFFIALTIRFDFVNWKKPWSIHDSVSAFDDAFTSEKLRAASTTFKSDIYTVAFLIKDTKARIGDEIQRCTEELRALEAAAEASLTAKLTAGSVLTYFNFPEAVKVPCEQYLIYFAQFLRDIGIEATTEVTENAGRVLFAVTPKDKDEALDTIREALDVYLHLPTAPNANNMADLMNADITIQRLSVNVSHLQNQWVLANATIQMQLAMLQAKDATIQAKEERIRYLELSNLITSGQVIIESRVEPEVSPEDERETVIEGILDVKRFDLWGAGDLNLPEIVRRLKAYVEQRRRKRLN